MSIEDILSRRKEFEAKVDKFGTATGSPVITVLFNHIDNLNAKIARLREENNLRQDRERASPDERVQVKWHERSG